MHGKGIKGSKSLIFLGRNISSEGISPRNELFKKFGDLKQPKNHQHLREIFGLCLQILNHQYCQHKILAPLSSYKRVASSDFAEDFLRKWTQVIHDLQRTLWHTHP